MMIVRELYAYREMIFSLVRRDLVGKYKKSILGFLWTFVEPLLQLCVYTFVFTVIMPMKNIDNFYLHLFVALIPWNFFATCLGGACTSVVDQQDMVKKIYFPREVLPIAYVTSQFVNMVLSFIVVFIVIVIAGVGISLKAVLWMPLVMLLQYIICQGIVLLTSSITVYFRDMQQILSVLSLALMYAAPVIYSVDMVPEEIRSAYMMNPMAVVIVAYRDILYYRKVPDVNDLLLGFVAGSLMLLIGYNTFAHLKKRFVEEL
ncbi:ABC transporter permease [bacterium 1XD42-54]|nr:ABC transporter permease [bacterium 1XD42-54]